ncbi:MAG: hypothetical protein ACK5S6_02365 [bacterium]
MSEQGFRGVPGVPDGFVVIAFREAMYKETYLDDCGRVLRWWSKIDAVAKYLIVQRIEKPKRYRQFANAEEFKPFRDRWWRYKSEKFTSRPPRGYDDCGWISGDTWGRLFDAIVFDDGSPFGVEVTE